MVSVAAGVAAGSVSLLGFGIESFLEVISGAAALWRVHAELDRKCSVILSITHNSGVLS
jgi:hypothetical protein